MDKYFSWNKVPKVFPKSIEELNDMSYSIKNKGDLYTVYGLGRSYGDVCLTEKGTLLLSRGLNKVIEFDPANGTIRCEAGASLNEILNLVTSNGWFLPVVPGTRFITIGGAISNDIHGKNHHKVGSFGNFVKEFEILRSDGERVVCNKSTNEKLFSATIGGLGLTGLITWAEIELIPIVNEFVSVENQGFESLEDYWIVNERLEKDWEYAVGWLDCNSYGRNVGRGVFHSGSHSSKELGLPRYREKRVSFPINLPFPLINSVNSAILNSIYYTLNSRRRVSTKHYKPFFFPLDSINHWNRAYGNKGFFQYQCVFPPENSKESVKELLEVIKNSDQNSYLGVIKNFGSIRSEGIISFPRPGTTIALDFPNKGEKTLNLFNELDAIIKNSKGALYPAKDARMSGEMFRTSFPKHEEFSKFIDPKFSSNYWERVS